MFKRRASRKASHRVCARLTPGSDLPRPRRRKQSWKQARNPQAKLVEPCFRSALAEGLSLQGLPQEDALTESLSLEGLSLGGLSLADALLES